MKGKRQSAREGSQQTAAKREGQPEVSGREVVGARRVERKIGADKAASREEVAVRILGVSSSGPSVRSETEGSLPPSVSHSRVTTG